MGGHKGIGIAMMVECLAGALTSSAPAPHVKRSDAMQGAFLWLVKPQSYAGELDFGAYMHEWTGTYVAAGGEGARLPGHRGDAAERDGLKQGIALRAAIVQELQALGERLRIAFPAYV